MIDIDNNPYFSMFQFPGGEWGVKWNEEKLKEPDGLPWDLFNLDLLARINNGNDLVKLLTFTDAARRRDIYIDLFLPYFPGARQDRVSNTGEPLTVKVYADIINAQKYSNVRILDPHSEVTPALLDNCIVQPVEDILKKIVTEGGYDTILIPDAGAAKKTFSYYFPDKEFAAGLNFVQCLKKRDTVTGKLSGFQIVDEITDRAKCLIVDDICDGGGTFLGMVAEIRDHAYYLRPSESKAKNISKLGLYVTHGIFSQGVTKLLDDGSRLTKTGIESQFFKGFDEIYTTNSIRPNQPDGVKVFNI